ncbi:hypothetical protein Taro_056448, partial [Colocasia esculenta]|nr:hypothetical protein [Colocasia esculenta]
FEAEELGVNIVCRQAHQPGCRRPDPLPLTSYKRQSMLPPTVVPQGMPQALKSLVWLIEEIGVVEEMIRRKVPSV